MPTKPTCPGVYVEEIPSSVSTITQVTTAATAFVGHTRRGPLNKPVRVTSYAGFDRCFGGLTSQSAVAYAVHGFFGNGGSIAVVVREPATAPGLAAGPNRGVTPRPSPGWRGSAEVLRAHGGVRLSGGRAAPKS
jgi:Bacteriophage tail sheath protein